MRQPIIALALISLAVTASGQNEGAFLTNIRQLTFEGKRAGEGYFSQDGTKMIFQSEREEGNPFYQIYLMDLETGDTERISPGLGKTTCAWIHPDGKRVMFASTHTDPDSKKLQEAEIKERLTAKTRRYSWDYDEHYDIFEYSLADKSLKNLTHTQGYDAEGCWSPDGRKMVFASNRQAYEGTLSPEDQERLKVDKQYFMEIYTADADGLNVKRLTSAPGYDGGPFFSADGSKICWRRFTEKGDQAEVWVMNADGRDQRQVTKLGAMSWAPYFHPSGDYLIFTTNLQGFANFELYIVDVEGKHEPVRVTTIDGFDGLPVFAPDGRKLSWTSGRTAGGASQIYLADWNDAAARKALGLANGVEAAKAKSAPDLATTASEIRAEDLRLHLSYLASDKLEGRLTGTPGEKLATEYMAGVFEKLGLNPEGDGGSWYQTFEFTAGVALGPKNRLTVNGGQEKRFEVNRGWRPLSFSQTADFPEADVVFVGYGIETPPEASTGSGKPFEAYSSYAHADVKNKWVLMLRYLPENLPQERRNDLARYTSLRYKALVARQRGALGILVASGPTSKVVDQLVPLAFDASLASSGIAAISVTDELAQELLSSERKDLKDLQTHLDTGELMPAIALPRVRIGAVIDIQQEKRTGRNVLARLNAGTQPNDLVPPLIIGAHIDHLGKKGGSNSRARGDDVNKIHYGADDNASGSSGLLEIAQYLVAQKQAGKLAMKRDIVFGSWSGEEIGLLGSAHYVQQLAKATAGGESAKLTGKIAACLNMDMIGRLTKNLIMQGVGSSSWWPREIEQRNVPIGLAITTQNDAYLPTDSTSFYTRGVPALSAFTGAHEDYHTPGDTADKINYDGAAKITRLMALIARSIVTSSEAPDYVVMEAPKNQGARTGLRAYLGTIPDYAQGDIKGVKLSGVSPIGPAAKAGVKGGDVIVKLGGKDVQNIYDYTYVMGELKIGAETTITVQRDGKEVTMKIIPGSRD